MTFINMILVLVGMVAMAGTAHAQLTVEKKITVDKNVPDNGVLRTGFTWSGSGLSAIDSVSVSLNVSSPFASNPIDLSDLSGNIRHGLTGETGARTGTLFSAGSMNSMSQTFTQAASMDGSWLASNYWRLDLSDVQGGGIAQLEDFTFSVTGTAATGGTLDVGAGGTITAASAGNQEIGAAITSSGSGTNAVKLNAGAGSTLQASGGLNGSGELKKQGEGALKLNSSSAGFTGKLRVEAGEVEIGNANALGSGTLDVSDGAKLRVNPGVSLSNAIAVASGQMQLDGGTNNTDISTVSSVISGTGGIEKTGAGKMVLTGTNTYTGATDISGGKLVVNGNIASSSKVTVETGGTLGGSGTVGALEVASGGTLAVGNSPGTLNAGNTTWAGGASLAWEVDDSNGNEVGTSGFLTNGQGSNWDFLNVTGTLNITATSGNKFIIDVISLLNGTNNGGSADGFNLNTAYSFAIATASGGIQIGGTGLGGYASEGAFNSALLALFDINTGSFANNPNSDALWSISTSSGGTNLLLSYAGTPGGFGGGGGGGGGVAIPEPSSASMVVLGLAALLAKRRRAKRG